MPDEPRQPPGPDWREAQHRVRNDMQTLTALFRLARRRAPGETLLDEYPEWVNALAALYDAHPVWNTGEETPVDDLILALDRRGFFPRPVRLVGASPVAVSAPVALATTLGVLGLLQHGCHSARPGSTVTVGVSAGEDAIRVEAGCDTDGSSAPEPPLLLSLAAEVMGGRVETADTADRRTVALIFPQP